MVRAGRQGENEKKALEQNIVTIGYQALPDLTSVKSKEELKKIFEEKIPGKNKKAIANQAGQVWSFINNIKVGDLVALPLKTQSAIAIGRVKGPYKYRNDLGELAHHTRDVEWIRKDIPRTDFDPDLLYSLGAFMTVCKIHRNNAENRIKAMLEGKVIKSEEAEEEELKDYEQATTDQIMKFIGEKFKGHGLPRLVEAVIQAQGYVTSISEPGPDGGVDILAGSGPFGFEPPRICVQVKSSSSPSDVNVLRSLQGTCTSFKADQGLLVSWGGFKLGVREEAKRSFFSIRLWDSGDFLEQLLKNYEKFPETLKAELPLKRIWCLVPEE